jgi:hypothetical protein
MDPALCQSNAVLFLTCFFFTMSLICSLTPYSSSICLRGITNKLTNARCFLENLGFSASQEIPHILWNPKICYRVNKNPPLIPILSQFNPVRAHDTELSSSSSSSSYCTLTEVFLTLPEVFCAFSSVVRQMPG